MWSVKVKSVSGRSVPDAAGDYSTFHVSQVTLLISIYTHWRVDLEISFYLSLKLMWFNLWLLILQAEQEEFQQLQQAQTAAYQQQSQQQQQQQMQQPSKSTAQPAATQLNK